MATAAQLEANRRNAQQSTGPKTHKGKARARLNSLKHGMSARTVTVIPVLPHEDPRVLEDRIQQWITDMEPRNAVERELVSRAARLSWLIERAERFETAHLARRVRQAGRNQKLSARRLKKVRDLGRKLLYDSGPRTQHCPGPPWDDEPSVFLRGLEESAEGCRWLLERWAEFRNLLDRKAGWTSSEMFRFIRLQGKQVVEAVYDPALNVIFLAWEVFGAGFGQKFWNTCKEETPSSDPGYSRLLVWREIAPRPRDRTEALAVLCSVVDQHIGRLEELLTEHEEIALEEAAERADRAAFDPSAGFERHRRYRSACGRELLRTLDTLRKMRNVEFGTGNGDGEMADDKCQMADDKCRMADDKCEARSGGCGKGERSEPTPEVSQGQMVGHDSNRVIDDSTDDKIGILSHDGPDPADRPCQGPCVRHGQPCGVKTPQTAPNEANPASTQNSISHKVESSAHEQAGHERTRSAAGGAVPLDDGNDPFGPITPPGAGNRAAPCHECRFLV